MLRVRRRQERDIMYVSRIRRTGDIAAGLYNRSIGHTAYLSVHKGLHCSTYIRTINWATDIMVIPQQSCHAS